jgi:hypothetical protein
MAVLHALWLARDLGLHQIVVEEDCASLFSSGDSNETCFTSFRNLVDDIGFNKTIIFVSPKRKG